MASQRWWECMGDIVGRKDMLPREYWKVRRAWSLSSQGLERKLCGQKWKDQEKSLVGPDGLWD